MLTHQRSITTLLRSYQTLTMCLNPLYRNSTIKMTLTMTMTSHKSTPGPKKRTKLSGMLSLQTSKRNFSKARLTKTRHQSEGSSSKPSCTNWKSKTDTPCNWSSKPSKSSKRKQLIRKPSFAPNMSKKILTVMKKNFFFNWQITSTSTTLNGAKSRTTSSDANLPSLSQFTQRNRGISREAHGL